MYLATSMCPSHCCASRFRSPEEATGSWRFRPCVTGYCRAVVRVIQPTIEPYFSDASFAYRPSRSVALALAEVEYWRDMGLRWVFEADIKNFFASISHKRLQTKVQQWVADDGLRRLIDCWTECVIWWKAYG